MTMLVSVSNSRFFTKRLVITKIMDTRELMATTKSSQRQKLVKYRLTPNAEKKKNNSNTKKESTKTLADL